MSLSDLASLGSFVSGVAVLVSLVFLYFQLGQLNRQVRQAERNQQAATRQGRTATAVQIALAVADSDVAQAVWAARVLGDGPTEVQLTQFLGLTRAVFANYEDVFYQHRAGLLDDIAFEAWKRTALSGLGLAARRVAWKWSKGSYGAEFEAYVDHQLEQIPVAPAEQRTERWKIDLAAELSNAA